MPEFYMTLARKISEIPDFLKIFFRKINKIARFHIIIARRIFSRFFFWGGQGPPVYTPMISINLRNCSATD